MGREIGAVRDVSSSAPREYDTDSAWSRRDGSPSARFSPAAMLRPGPCRRGYNGWERGGGRSSTAKSFIVIALGSVSGGRSCGTGLDHELVTDASGRAARLVFALSSSPICVYLIRFCFLSPPPTACIVSLQNPHILPVLFVNP